MLACKKCLYPINHPFGLELYNGVCSGCITHQEKDSINWEERRKALIEILDVSTKRNKSYDCVVPVVGDAEDYYVLSLVLDLGLSPLVVGVNDYFKNDIGWHNLHNLITYFDVDSVFFNPDFHVYQELIKTSLRKYDSILLPFHNLHTAFPVHVAHDRNIPLVIWGQNQSVEQVGKFSHLDSVEMSRWSRREHDLFNVEVDTLIGNGAQIDTRKLNYYRYPAIKKIARRNIQGLYLSNFFRWDPLSQNSSSCQFGFWPEPNSTTFDPYERAGSSVYYNIHDLLKLKRTGYRKFDDHLAREIRHGRVDANTLIELKSEYAGASVEIKPFFKWLGVSESGYQWYVEHRLSSFTKLIKTGDGNRSAVLSKHFSLVQESSSFARTPNKQFILFGKGI
ncbi:N-acetyl sugar amidotransferase [Halomonas sp. ISL-60]|uniref:N-acetyl sugar amidotransferase n=1 Tax=Halomonas sp. ISL-56 TaxID=2819149 RepID=UPI001BE6A579|nr:N-acetyl sugar amidotransferase [Halomonas sp. ISL-56]MBT2772444.1 N-acetyl sugar amidotransferase [Halomonas sp. ISL-60]MBT2803375.1 N-acetyl sugar amidotransferase [Halomonas sp. ISL-56]